jgi:hypothetical protein
MLVSHLNKYKYKYVIAIFLLILLVTVIWFTLFAMGKTRSIDTFKPLQPKSLVKDKSEHFYPCNNFCGPKGECAINREQCVSNSECAGCIKETSLKNPIVLPAAYNTSFKEGFSSTSGNTSLPMYKSPETSSLTTDISNFATVIEKDAKVPKMNLGVDLWTKAFNYGLKLEESKLNYDFVLYPSELEYQPKYNTTETSTGMFNDIGPTAANASL